MTELARCGFIYDTDDTGVVTVTLDMPGPVNAMNELFRVGMLELVTRLEQQCGLRGVIFASAKKTFFAGGDVKEMLAADLSDRDTWSKRLHLTNTLLRRIEHLRVPVVAAINGAALGGGFELCLACNRRIAVRDIGASIGFPEVTIGLFPGAGGIVRSVYLIGLKNALPLVLDGTRLTASTSQALGLIDELVDDIEDLLPAAHAWIRSNPTAWVQPWDAAGRQLPGDDLVAGDIHQFLSDTAATIQDRTRGLMPAPQAIVEVARHTVSSGFHSALQTQEKLFVDLFVRPETRNVMTANFVDLTEVKSGRLRPGNFEKTEVRRLGVLGAGMMGRGIAQVAASRGILVVLKDVRPELAEQAKATISSELSKAVKAGRISTDQAARTLEHIQVAADLSALQGCDFVVEAVFEDVEIKAEVTRAVQSHLAADCMLGSNTSTLPITLLAQASECPENFVGTHFFSPVDRMQLVEIIRGERTSEATLARAIDFAIQLGKLPIVVNDTPGFFTSRVYGPYMDEGSRLVEDGVDPALVDPLAREIGMPVGPLAAHDEVSLELTRKAIATLRKIGVYGKTFSLDANGRMADLLIGRYNRGGRHYGGGFYEYPANGPKFVWPVLYEIFHKPDAAISTEDVKDRILFRQVVESLKCLDEGVVTSVAEANIGALYGLGAPAWTGGYIQFVNTYGLRRFAARATQLADRYGERFRPPAILDRKIAAGEAFR